MKNYFNTNKKELCNGCGACALRCPKNAIKMAEDEEGFLYPVIDKSKCIDCKVCEKVCSNKNDSNLESEAYIAVNNNKEELKISASGGIFYILAKYVIENNGVVFGVAYNNKLEAVHEYAETIEECKKFCGSKYVRSDLKDTYKEAKEFLDNGKIVLYTGTACQLSGLKSFLGKEYNNLLLCDILCHANPSPKVFKMYKENLKKIHKKEIKDIKFRAKETGWKNSSPLIEFKTGEKIEESSYYRAFVRELINRPSCSSCVFASKNRVTDITIGDFWGIEKVDNAIDESNGVSLILVNSEKAKKIIKEINKKAFLEKVSIEDATRYNHFYNTPVHKNRNDFFRGMQENYITSENIIEYMRKYTNDSFLLKIKNKIKNILKKS